MMRCFKEQLQTRVLRSSAAPAAPTEGEEIDISPVDLGAAKDLRELWAGARGKKHACAYLAALGSKLASLKENKGRRGKKISGAEG
eukprot:13739986-Alexandrium_andersonii.AAC.1